MSKLDATQFYSVSTPQDQVILACAADLATTKSIKPIKHLGLPFPRKQISLGLSTCRGILTVKSRRLTVVTASVVWNIPLLLLPEENQTHLYPLHIVLEGLVQDIVMCEAT
jgi:hypothetical protein